MKIDYSVFKQKTAIDRFIFAINNKYFVEAHELLEDDWKNYKKIGEKDKALVLKGLINGATALALFFKKNKPEGYKKVWNAFEKYIILLEKINIKDKEKYYLATKTLVKINSSIKINTNL